MPRGNTPPRPDVTMTVPAGTCWRYNTPWSSSSQTMGPSAPWGAAIPTTLPSQEAAQARVLAAELRDEGGGEGHGIALRHDRVVPVPRRREQLGLALQKQEGREHTLAQSLGERVTPLIGKAQRGDRQPHAEDEQ